MSAQPTHQTYHDAPKQLYLSCVFSEFTRYGSFLSFFHIVVTKKFTLISLRLFLRKISYLAETNPANVLKRTYFWDSHILNRTYLHNSDLLNLGMYKCMYLRNLIMEQKNCLGLQYCSMGYPVFIRGIKTLN